MIQKICPYCDQVITGSVYCSNCRSRIHPSQIRKIDFYLNQRHPGSEEDCSYHAALPKNPIAPDRNRKKSGGKTGEINRTGKRKEARRRSAEAVPPVMPPADGRKRDGRRKGKGGAETVVTVGFWLLLVFLLQYCTR